MGCMACVSKVGFLLPTIQLTGALAVNGFALLAFVYTWFDKEAIWLHELHSHEWVSALWCLVPYWLWPTIKRSDVSTTVGQKQPVAPTWQLASDFFSSKGSSGGSDGVGSFFCCCQELLR